MSANREDLRKIISLSNDLGWSISYNAKEDGSVDGVIIGDPEFISWVLNRFNDAKEEIEVIQNSIVESRELNDGKLLKKDLISIVESIENLRLE